MILDKETQMITATALDLEAVRPGSGEPIKMFASGMTPAAVVTVTTGDDAAEAEGGTIPCTTAVIGAKGSVEFELPSTTKQFIACTFAGGDLNVTLAGNQTAV